MQQRGLRQLDVVGGAQEVEQVAARHELGENEVGRLAGANAQQLHQIRMVQTLHQISLGQKVRQRHCVFLQVDKSNFSD